MAVLTPTWTDNISIQAITTLARNAVVRNTWDLRGKHGAWIYFWIGRGGTTGLTNGIDLLCQRSVNNLGVVVPNPQIFRGDATAASGTTCAASGNNAGSASLTVASTAGFAAGDFFCIQDNASPTSLTEWCRVARVTDATHLLLTSPTISAHNNTAHTVRNHADSWYTWLEGGATHEIIVDYGAQAAGDTITVLVMGQTLDNYNIA